MTTTAKCVKKALIRDSSVPMGQPAPLHVNCECGQQVEIVEALNECSACHTTYTSEGWIVDED